MDCCSIVGWGHLIKKDLTIDGTIWASTSYEILRTNGIDHYIKHPEDFPEAAAGSFSGFALDKNSIIWIGADSSLIKLNTNTGSYTTIQRSSGWPFPGENVRPLAATSDGRLWMQYDSAYPSNDNGLCWYDGVNVGSFPAPPGGVPQWGGLPNSNIKKLEVREIPGGYELWMSCLGRGMAVLTVIDGTTIVENEKELPTSFMLSQNYPNPFNPTTKISFSISSSAFTSLKVYDILGNEVEL